MHNVKMFFKCSFIYLLIYLQKDMLEAYYKKKNLLEIFENINKSYIDILSLKWARSSNIKDCGVYLMRHMETYVGKKDSEWNVGFSAHNIKILQVLRGRYCYNLIASSYNNQRVPILEVADAWMEENKHKLNSLNNKYKKWFVNRKK